MTNLHFLFMGLQISCRSAQLRLNSAGLTLLRTSSSGPRLIEQPLPGTHFSRSEGQEQETKPYHASTFKVPAWMWHRSNCSYSIGLKQLMDKPTTGPEKAHFTCRETVATRLPETLSHYRFPVSA